MEDCIPAPATPHRPHFIKRFFAALGPGLITGAADDDPSGIATYSIAGAQLGTSLLWMAWFTCPLMAGVQMMCARIGMVTGEGLAGTLGKKFPRPVLVIVCIALLVANTINIAADLSGMADAAEILTGLSSHLYVIGFGMGIAFAVVQFCYYSIANILKWLTVFLLAYIATAFLVHPHWGEIAKQTFTPSFPHGKEMWETVVAILGTTISPYLFFWQSSQEVEEEKALGRRHVKRRRGATPVELVNRMIDVGTGAVLSNSVMFFIILTAALTLHTHGITEITTSKQAAEALKPLAGDLAMLLYTVGLVAVGLLAIPTLAGSSAYAFAEVFHLRQGLDQKLLRAKWFYGIIVLSVFMGIGLNFLQINPVKALFWSAIVNGLVAPFLLTGIFIIARDKKIMAGQPSSLLNQAVVFVTAVLMYGATIGMFIV